MALGNDVVSPEGKTIPGICTTTSIVSMQHRVHTIRMIMIVITYTSFLPGK